MFAGFGTALDTNRRFHELLAAGSDGLSTAFDLPDADGPRLRRRARARRGRQVRRRGRHARRRRGPLPRHRPRRGHDVDDDQRPGRGDLRDVRRQRGATGRRARAARRHAPERHPEGVPGAEGVHLPAPPVAAAGRRHDRASAPRRCRAGTRSRSPATTSAKRARPRREELAFTVAQRVRVRRARACRPASTVDAFAPRLSFFFNAHIDFFEEIAKYRAARRIWARWMRDRYGARARTVAADAVPHPDRGRVAHRAAARGQHRAHRDRGARGRARRHAEPAHQLDGRDARAADREGGADRAPHPAGDRATRPRVTNVADPLGGSWYVEALTDEMERRAEEIFAHIEAMGDGSMLDGAVARRRGGLVPVARSPTPRTSSNASSTPAAHVVVGVNAFLEGNDEPPPDDPAHRPRGRRGAAPAAREGEAPNATPTRSSARSPGCAPTPREPTINLMPAFLDAVHAVRDARRDRRRAGDGVRPLGRAAADLTSAVRHARDDDLDRIEPLLASCGRSTG